MIEMYFISLPSDFNIFTHAYGIRENNESNGHLMKYISIITRKLQLSSIYYHFVIYLDRRSTDSCFLRSRFSKLKSYR